MEQVSTARFHDRIGVRRLARPHSDWPTGLDSHTRGQVRAGRVAVDDSCVLIAPRAWPRNGDSGQAAAGLSASALPI